jgi:hypothetical protein
MTELPQPLMVRRAVCFGEAVYGGGVCVEGIHARLAPDAALAMEFAAQGLIPVLGTRRALPRESGAARRGGWHHGEAQHRHAPR